MGRSNLVSKEHSIILISKFKCLQDYVVTRFNEHLKDLDDTARHKYLI